MSSSLSARTKSRLFPSPLKGTQRLLRYPIFIIVIIIVVIELIFYFILRFGVIVYEQILDICHCYSKRKVLWKGLRRATDYQQYTKLAKELDNLSYKNEWKCKNDSYCYDIQLVQSNLNKLKRYQKNKDYMKMSESLIEIFNHILQWFDQEELYTQTNHGTKYIVNEFINTVEESIKLFRNCDDNIVKNKDKLKIFCRLQQEFGRTCLCLSGGATMTYYQFGVCRTLFVNGLLPQIICGTSGGSLVGSCIAVRTDEELEKFLNPSMYDCLNAADEPWIIKIKRLLMTKNMFSWDDWAQKMKKITKGDTTFLEAYERTGRIFNVTAISTNHSPVLLNYKTTPNVTIWSAVICSSSLPLCMKPSPLMQKKYDCNGSGNYTLSEFNNYGRLWCDGSIQFDVPKQRLLEDFNVKYTICVQCNAHVFVFYYNGRGTANSPVSHLGSTGMRGGFLSSFLEKILKLELRKWMEILGEFDLIPMIWSIDLRHTALQQNRGTITINPKPGLCDFLCLIIDPDLKRMKRYYNHGRQITFPYIYMIENRMRLQNIIRDSIKYLDQKGDTLHTLLETGYNIYPIQFNSNNTRSNKLSKLRRTSI